MQYGVEPERLRFWELASGPLFTDVLSVEQLHVLCLERFGYAYYIAFNITYCSRAWCFKQAYVT